MAAMDLRDVETMILDGRDPNEAPADVLFMANAVADTLNRDSPYIPIRHRFPIPGAIRSSLAAATYAAGLLICPIFDPVKHESYARSMTEARLRFRGIAQDPELRNLFRENIREARRVGALRTLEAAMDLELHQILERGAPLKGLKY